MTIRVILANDHKLFLDTLSLFLENEEGIKVVGVDADGSAIQQLSASLRPDVIVIGDRMPGMKGIEATRRLVDANPGIKVVALSTFSRKHHALEMLNAGADAYVNKENPGSTLVSALHTVMNVHKYPCANDADETTSRVEHNPIQVKILGRREREVLRLLSEGDTSSAIAKRLFISASTVAVHRRNIMRKLDLHCIAELTKYAVRNGLTGV